jgi:hypothetical protein
LLLSIAGYVLFKPRYANILDTNAGRLKGWHRVLMDESGSTGQIMR